MCPACDLPLVFKDSAITDTKVSERYDRYACTIHGQFEYRHRTRKLRPVVTV